MGAAALSCGYCSVDLAFARQDLIQPRSLESLASVELFAGQESILHPWGDVYGSMSAWSAPEKF